MLNAPLTHALSSGECAPRIIGKTWESSATRRSELLANVGIFVTRDSLKSHCARVWKVRPGRYLVISDSFGHRDCKYPRINKMAANPLQWLLSLLMRILMQSQTGGISGSNPVWVASYLVTKIPQMPLKQRLPGSPVFRWISFNLQRKMKRWAETHK